MSYQIPKPMTDEAGYIPYDQVMELIDSTTDFRDKLLLTLLFRSGRRVSEVVRSLKPRDVDFKEGMILWHILKKKDKNYKRWKPIDKDTLGMLWNYIELKRIDPDQFVFGICRSRVFQIVRKYGNKIGLDKVGNKHIHPHHLRHSFAVHLARNMRSPADLAFLQDLLEHSDIRFTLYYLQFAPKETRAILERSFK